MKKLGLALLLFWNATAFARVADYCERYAADATAAELMRQLSDRLQYSYEDFCYSERIADVFQEKRRVYHRETDSFQPYIFVTIHYYEYSCEYQYNLEQKRWLNQHCYNTF